MAPIEPFGTPDAPTASNTQRARTSCSSTCIEADSGVCSRPQGTAAAPTLAPLSCITAPRASLPLDQMLPHERGIAFCRTQLQVLLRVHADMRHALREERELLADRGDAMEGVDLQGPGRMLVALHDKHL